MNAQKKIGTIQVDGGEAEVVGVCNMDGRWTANVDRGAEVSEVPIPSKTTFGQIKQAAAEHFANPKYAFSRFQGEQAAKPDMGIPTSEPAPERIDGALQDPAEPAPEKSEADHIREHLEKHPGETNKQVIACLAEIGVEVSSSQVSAIKRELKGDG